MFQPMSSLDMVTAKRLVAESYEVYRELSVSKALTIETGSHLPAHYRCVPETANLDARQLAGIPKMVMGPGLLSHSIAPQ